MTSSPWTLPLSILASVAVGAVLGVTLGRETRLLPDPIATSTERDELAPAVRALVEELARDRGRSSPLAAPVDAPARALVGASEGDVAAEIREATKLLAQALERMQTSVGAFRAERAPLVVPTVAPDLALLGTFRNVEIWSQGKPFLLSTYQQVLDRFGMPTQVDHNDCTVTWNYATTGDGWVDFTFSDGRVVLVRCGDP